MSIKGKGLSYEAQEPAFLRKLRDQQAGNDPDRHERALARPRRAKAGGTDDDDAPTYVDAESNQTLSKEEYEGLLKDSKGIDGDKIGGEGPGLEQDPSAADKPMPGNAAMRAKQEVTETGKTQKKRKAAKAIGVDDEAVPEDEEKPKATTKKPKKKAKVVSLSFGDHEG